VQLRGWEDGWDTIFDILDDPTDPLGSTTNFFFKKYGTFTMQHLCKSAKVYTMAVDSQARQDSAMLYLCITKSLTPEVAQNKLTLKESQYIWHNGSRMGILCLKVIIQISSINILAFRSGKYDVTTWTTLRSYGSMSQEYFL